MALNPTYKSDASGVWTLYWTADPNAVGYDILLADGAHVQAGPGATQAKLGAKPTAAPKIRPNLPGVYETAVDASQPVLTVTQTVTDGMTLTSPITWEAKPSAAVARVEFLIDGQKKWQENFAPYVFNGDGKTLDPATLAAGQHELRAQAFTAAGAKAEAAANVTVQATVPPPVSGTSGRVGYAVDMGGGWADGYVANASLHDEILAQWDGALCWLSSVPAWFPRAWNYIDSYAIYPSQVSLARTIMQGLDEIEKAIPPFATRLRLEALRRHAEAVIDDDHDRMQLGQPLTAIDPNWILKTADGKRVYIDYACSGGVCTQFAADVGNHGWWDEIVRRAKAALALGYQGIMLDDVNLTFRFSNGSTKVVPIDPRTNAPLTPDNWNRYFCDFLEYVRAQVPQAVIGHNSIWFAGPSHNGLDPYSQRQFKAADWIMYEFGFVDGGLTGGTGEWSFDRIMHHQDAVHGAGANTWTMSHGASTLQQAELNLAAALMTSVGGDFMYAQYGNNPTNFWNGYKANLAADKGPRVRQVDGLFRREFDHGTALVNEPGSTQKTVQVSGKRIDGSTVTSVTLPPRSGAVILR